MAKIAVDLPPVNQRVLDFVISQGIAKHHVRRTLIKVCGVTGSAVYQWFTTTQNIKHEHLLSIAKTFGTTVDWLLTGEAQETPAVRQEEQSAASNPVAKELIRLARSEIQALSRSLENRDTQTAGKLQKISMELDEVVKIL
jgi:transcriptional regulator with XRE-family HTH domain